MGREEGGRAGGGGEEGGGEGVGGRGREKGGGREGRMKGEEGEEGIIKLAIVTLTADCANIMSPLLAFNT